MEANKKLTRIGSNKGAHIGNQNSRRNGIYCKKYDKRTREGKALQRIELELATALGDVSPQKVLLVQRSDVST